MSWALLVIRDGRDEYHERSIASAEWALPTPDQTIVVDDADHSLGFAGAIQKGWDQVETDWVFHLEADFIFNCRPPLDTMRWLVESSVMHRGSEAIYEGSLAQVALKRQAWSPAEIEAGGIIEQHPADFNEVTFGGTPWTEHRRFFTTNPCLYPRRIVDRGWPQVSESEGHFTHQLLADGYRFAFLGGRCWPPYVTHIGEHRAGKGY